MKLFNPITLVFLAVCLLGCKNKIAIDKMSDEELRKYAQDLADKDLIIDGHVDLPYLVMEKKWPGSPAYPGVLIHTSIGEFDFDRAKKGGLDAPFMSIYIPSLYQKQPDHGMSLADSLIDIVKQMPVQFPAQFALANSPADVRKNTGEGKISLPMGMENGAPIGTDLKNVKYLFDRGIRYITLTHGQYNQVCGSSGDTTLSHQGLTPFGKTVVKEMNRVGIMVDISHVDDSTFYQVMKLTKVPCIASHSSCRYFAPQVPRDMSDDMIKRLGENGGVVMINFYNGFLDSTVNRELRKVREMLKQKTPGMSDSAALGQFKKDFPVDIETVTDHIDHVAKLIGVEHVGFGSDFDGVDGLLPNGLTDVSMFPNLIYSLLKRGYSSDDIEKITGGNVIRVWQQALDAAKTNH